MMPEPFGDLLDHRAWDSVSDETQVAFLRGGEEMVKATLSLGHAADMRATTIMGIFGAVGVALSAAVATLIAGSRPPSWSLIIGGYYRYGTFPCRCILRRCCVAQIFLRCWI
jgi:hypothetical protein